MINRTFQEPTHVFPGSKKIYIEGKKSSLQVPFREIELSPTLSSRGVEKENENLKLEIKIGSFKK